VDLGGHQAARLQLGRRTKLVTRPGLLVSQATIEDGLRRRFAELGGEIEWGRGVLGATNDGDGVTVTLTDGTVARCTWLVGCDGAHSHIRTVAGIDFPGVQTIERFLLADVRAALPVPRDTVFVWLRGSDMFAAFPLPGRDLWRLMAPAPGDAAAGDETTPLDVMDLLTRQMHERTGFPASLVHQVEWTSVFRIHRRLAEHYRRGRILLAGDSAHIHSPLGGQGLNTGIGDAENLAWKLALVVKARATAALLDTYEAERRPIAAEVLESTSVLTRMVVGDSRLARVLRDRVFVPALNRPAVQRLIWEQASQLKVSYRRGPLARGPGGPLTFRPHLTSRPHPGDRVPDLACVRLDGGATRLHAELGSRWVLLTPSATTAHTAELIGACGEIARARLGAVTVLNPAAGRLHHAILVRPDAHAGWCGKLSPEALDGWLTAMLGVGRTPDHGQPDQRAAVTAPILS